MFWYTFLNKVVHKQGVITAIGSPSGAESNMYLRFSYTHNEILFPYFIWSFKVDETQHFLAGFQCTNGITKIETGVILKEQF